MADVLTVVRNSRDHRYEAQLDGVVVAFSKFRIRPGQLVFTHTETGPEYAGRGYASQLARGLLDDVRARGEQLVPVCPFIKAYLDKHPEYADLVAAE